MGKHVPSEKRKGLLPLRPVLEAGASPTRLILRRSLGWNLLLGINLDQKAPVRSVQLQNRGLKDYCLDYNPSSEQDLTGHQVLLYLCHGMGQNQVGALLCGLLVSCGGSPGEGSVLKGSSV